MKKMLIALLVTASAFFTLVFTLGTVGRNKSDEFKVAMVTDFSDVNDGSFNQACYEGAKEWSRRHNVTFNYYKPASISPAERIKSMRLAIDRGYNVILCPGFALGEPISIVAPEHPNVQFIGLDISGLQKIDNVTVYNYQEEIAGYLAGYAAVKEGKRKLGFLGGQEYESITRYGYGYIQGADAAAEELEEHIKIDFVYGGQFFGSPEIHNYIDQWYKSGTEIVFSCGGSIYTSVALAAKENGGYMIGVDDDQAPIVDRDYKPGVCITSAMKMIKKTVIDKLELCYQGIPLEGDTVKLGLVSGDNVEENYVQLPLSTWENYDDTHPRMKNFTYDDYKDLVKHLFDNPGTVSPEIGYEPIDVPHSEYTTIIAHDPIN